ncbi:hypothetical protein FACS1894184_14120 [Clostridia bacterium]|nr:hypothetical protein FACS1894184_14120 [Clostridia bacterium]
MVLAAQLLFACNLQDVIHYVENEAFRGQWVEKVKCVDIMLDQIKESIGSDNGNSTEYYYKVLAQLIDKLGQWQGVYAVLYDTSGIMQTESSDDEISLLPSQLDQIWASAIGNDAGDELIEHVTKTGLVDEVHVYFRWMVMSGNTEVNHSGRRDCVLFIIAMGKSTKEAHPTDVFIPWCVGFLAVSIGYTTVSGVAFMARPRKKGGIDECR